MDTTNLTNFCRRVLVTSSDEKYLPGLIVAIASALGRLPAGFEVDVVVYDEGLSERTRAELRRIVERAHTASRLHLEQGFSQLGRDLPVAGHVTEATYSRLLIPELSPDLERAVYIDADLLVVDDISELFTMDLGGAIFAACVDKDTPTVQGGVPYSYEALELPPERQYFNAGLLVMDVPAWRDAGVSAATADYALRWDAELRCPDQEGINVVCGDRAVALDPRFNFQVSGEAIAAAAAGDGRAAHQSLRRAAIVHFTGPKPWLKVWFSSSIWARPTAWWWSVALGSRLISPRMRARLLSTGAEMGVREVRRLARRA
jgi:lipopolysaccharide biosynthesis glycosyltransferase